jgi:hypothetical protein
MKSYQTILLTGLAMLIVCGIVWANSNGINFEALTGAPGESTCADCHGTLDSGPGSVSITADFNYTPGDTLDVTVDISQAGQTRWGFELTALDGSNQMAGDLVATDTARMLVTTAGSGRQYIKQTTLGTDDTHGNNTSWSFKWAAPVSDVGPVTFYVCGVAANGASGPNGDFCYSDTYVLLTTDVVDSDDAGLPQGFRLAQNYPNPFNPATTIEFDLSKKSAVELVVYNVLGQEVKVLTQGDLGAGTHQIVWDGTDNVGQTVASGLYFYRLKTEQFVSSNAMLLLK